MTIEEWVKEIDKLYTASGDAEEPMDYVMVEDVLRAFRAAIIAKTKEACFELTWPLLLKIEVPGMYECIKREVKNAIDGIEVNDEP